MTDINVICLTDASDIAFSNIAQKSTVTGATLPSGFNVPTHGIWKIIDKYLINVDYLINNQHTPN
jgi:hypothetical protein